MKEVQSLEVMRSLMGLISGATATWVLVLARGAAEASEG
jgi:hypothetical protein